MTLTIERYDSKQPCLKCGHLLSSHLVQYVGNHTLVEVACKEQGQDVHDCCECNAGLSARAIKVSFSEESK